jgi:hypothetical protein
MLHTRIVEDMEGIRGFIAPARELAEAAESTLPFHQLEIPIAWWTHFHGTDGKDFGSKRGRNFHGTKTVLQKPVFAAAEEDGRLLGLAPMVLSQVSLRGSKEPMSLLSFSADSVIVFFQDLLTHPEKRQAVVDALVETLAAYAEANDALLFLGHIPEDSANVPCLDKAWAALKGRGWHGGVAINRFRGGVYPWTIPKLVSGLERLRKTLGDADADTPALDEMLLRLEKQGPTLLNFNATRVALEKAVLDLLAHLQNREATREAGAAMAAAIAEDFISYPYLPLAGNREDYFEALSSSKRYYFRRYRRKFEELGGAFENLAPGQITAADIEDYLQLHLLRWGNDSVAVNTHTLPFHREICLQAARNGTFRLFFARHGGKRIAAHVCFDIGKRREYFFSGRDPAEEELRAGKLMVMETILDAHDKGMRIYDFGYGGDEYKADFTRIARRVRSYFLARRESLLDLENLFPKYEYMKLE